MKINDFITVAEACKSHQGARSEKFIYTALKLRKIKGIRLGRLWLIPKAEILRLRDGQIKLSREEMGVK